MVLNMHFPVFCVPVSRKLEQNLKLHFLNFSKNVTTNLFFTCTKIQQRSSFFQCSGSVYFFTTFSLIFWSRFGWDFPETLGDKWTRKMKAMGVMRVALRTEFEREALRDLIAQKRPLHALVFSSRAPSQGSALCFNAWLHFFRSQCGGEGKNQKTTAGFEGEGGGERFPWDLLANIFIRTRPEICG